jgi:hypothetical protein
LGQVWANSGSIVGGTSFLGDSRENPTFRVPESGVEVQGWVLRLKFCNSNTQALLRLEVFFTFERVYD